MTGEELRKKLKETGVSQAEIARRLNVIPEVVGQKLEAKDIKTGFLEDLCRVLDKDIGFFYGKSGLSAEDADEKFMVLKDKVKSLEEENDKLRKELVRMNDPDLEKKESEIYRLWMEHMKITELMQELYKKQKEG